MTVGQIRTRLRYLPADMPVGMATGPDSDLHILSIYETQPFRDDDPRTAEEPRVDGKETLWFDLEEQE